MAAIFQTKIFNAFSWMKIFKFQLKFHWNLFVWVQITIFQQIMAWRQPGDKPLSAPMAVRLPTHICVTRTLPLDIMAAISQTIFSFAFSLMKSFDNNPALVQIMAWCRLGDKPLSDPMLTRFHWHIYVTRGRWVNLLSPGRCDRNLLTYIATFQEIINLAQYTCTLPFWRMSLLHISWLFHIHHSALSQWAVSNWIKTSNVSTRQDICVQYWWDIFICYSILTH